MSWQAVQQVFRTSTHRGITFTVLLAMAEHAEADGSSITAGIDRLARFARTNRRSVFRALKELQASGELVLVRKYSARGGTHEWRIPMVGAEVMPWADAHARPEVQTERQGVTGDKSDTMSDLSPEPSLRTSRRSKSRRDRIERQGVTGDTTSLSEGAAAPPESPEREARRIEAEAVALWQLERKRALGAKANYLDADAIRSMRRALRTALADGHIWQDIARAILDHASNRHSAAPWRLHEWADVVRAKRLEDEHEQRKAEERTQAERSHRGVTEAEWAALEAKYPGLTRAQIAERELFGGVLKPMPAADRAPRGAVVQLFAGRRAESTQAEGWPRIIGPDRIALEPRDFRCNGERCPRQGWRWVEMREAEAAVPVCRNCFDFAVAGSDAQREHVSSSPLVATDIDNAQRPRTATTASQVTA